MKNTFFNFLESIFINLNIKYFEPAFNFNLIFRRVLNNKIKVNIWIHLNNLEITNETTFESIIQGIQNIEIIDQGHLFI
jgi:hypothetical protein